MNFSNLMINQKFTNTKIYWALVVGLSGGLLYLYGYLGTSNESETIPDNHSIKDFGYWITAARQLNSFENPYTADPLFKSGVFSSSILYLFRLATWSDSLFFTVMQVLNILGLILFLFICVRINRSNTVVVLLLLSFSSTREILVNGQTTGVLLGVFSALYLVVKQLDNTKLHMKKTSYYVFSIVSGLCCFFLLDMKPNVFLFPIMVLFTKIPGRSTILAGIFLWVSHQIFFSIALGEFLFASWLTNLSQVISYSDNPNLYGSIGFWQIINQFFSNHLMIQYLPIIVYLILGFISIRIAISKPFDIALFLAFSTNYIYSYFHFYTFFPILAFMLLRVLSINSPFIAGFLVSTMEFSFIISTQNVLLSVILLTFICIFYKFNFSVYFFVLGWISSIFLRYGLINYYQGNLYLAKSIIVLIPFCLFLISIKKQEGSTIVKHRGD